jgi:hypothetical protein
LEGISDGIKDDEFDNMVNMLGMFESVGVRNFEGGLLGFFDVDSGTVGFIDDGDIVTEGFLGGINDGIMDDEFDNMVSMLGMFESVGVRNFEGGLLGFFDVDSGTVERYGAKVVAFMSDKVLGKFDPLATSSEGFFVFSEKLVGLKVG